MLLISKVWPLLIVGISKLTPSMFQSWLRPWFSALAFVDLKDFVKLSAASGVMLWYVYVS